MRGVVLSQRVGDGAVGGALVPEVQRQRSLPVDVAADVDERLVTGAPRHVTGKQHVDLQTLGVHEAVSLRTSERVHHITTQEAVSEDTNHKNCEQLLYSSRF